MAERVEQALCFPKKIQKMANKVPERCSTSLISREMQIKIKVMKLSHSRQTLLKMLLNGLVKWLGW